jgi:hypothetical protein
MSAYDNNFSLCPTGDVLIQISENQKSLTTELEGIVGYFTLLGKQ